MLAWLAAVAGTNFSRTLGGEVGHKPHNIPSYGSSGERQDDCSL